jgi:hypothetical protein
MGREREREIIVDFTNASSKISNLPQMIKATRRKTIHRQRTAVY